MATISQEKYETATGSRLFWISNSAIENAKPVATQLLQLALYNGFDLSQDPPSLSPGLDLLVHRVRLPMGETVTVTVQKPSGILR